MYALGPLKYGYKEWTKPVLCMSVTWCVCSGSPEIWVQGVHYASPVYVCDLVCTLWVPCNMGTGVDQASPVYVCDLVSTLWVPCNMGTGVDQASPVYVCDLVCTLWVP